jgi:RNA 2',3'-cyclic 3'-phosphodiesterase
LRLFVAAELPDRVSDQLAQWTLAAVGRGEQPRRLDPALLHLTLCFLGEQPPSAVAPIARALGESAELVAAVSDLRLGAPAWLPPRRPRVLAVEVGDPSGALGALREALVAELAAILAWDPGRERFRPHVTVARMRPGSQRARWLPPTPPLRFAPTAATLFRSALDPGGARYEALASTPA